MTLPAVRSLALVTTFLMTLLGPAPASAQSDELQDASQLFKQGQFDRALDRVNAYLSSRPKDARGRFLRGLILAEQNKPNDAIKVFTELTQDFPELPEPYNNLAVLYASQGQYDKARASLEMAIRTHPSYATAHENLGDIYARMASQAYDKALQLDKSNTTAQTKLNLIKDLFPAGSRPGAKPTASKPEASTPTSTSSTTRRTSPRAIRTSPAGRSTSTRSMPARAGTRHASASTYWIREDGGWKIIHEGSA